MIEKISPQELLENAASEIEYAMNLVFHEQSVVPFTSETDLQSLRPNEEELIRRAEETSYRERPALSAVNFCLMSCMSSLVVAHGLLAEPSDLPPGDRTRLWKKLGADMKLSLRAANRAAMVLSDPAAAQPDQGGALPASSHSSSEQQSRLAERSEILTSSSCYRHWNRIKSDKITASQFIEFLRPLADLEGLCVTHLDMEERIGEHEPNSEMTLVVPRQEPFTSIAEHQVRNARPLPGLRNLLAAAEPSGCSQSSHKRS